jgi:chloride channel protein, CIC family
VSAPAAEETSGLPALAVLALIVGAIAGLVGAVFRLSLFAADRARDWVIGGLQGRGIVGLALVVLGCAAAAAAATWLVRRFSPQASGSGIPHVEAVLEGELPPADARLIPVKFVGGVLAIGSGLALGREGPTVQMGAGIAHLVGRLFRRSWPDSRVLLAAGAGAGLATAFNAPIAGSIFVLEELVRRFDTKIAIAALGASATAIGVARLVLGDAPDFHVEVLTFPVAEARPLFFVLGALAGLLAILYNRTLLATLAVADRLGRWPVELRGGLIGAAVGALAWFAPALVGGGDPITQQMLLGAGSLAVIPLALLARLALGAVSYAAGTPGGLFAPMLVLGAQLGLLVGILCQQAFPGLAIQPQAFAVVGMAGLFTGVVRAPLTGIVLVIEMTASFTMFLPMLGACFMAMLVPTLLRDPPIYESLRRR